MAPLVEKSSTNLRKNKKKVQADKRHRDSNKTNAPEQLSAKNVLPNHELNGFCQMCNDCESDLVYQNQHDGKFNSSCQREFFEEDADEGKEERYDDVLDFTDWSVSARTELQSLVISNLDAVFKIAMKKIVASGYSEDIATKAVMNPGICYGSKDMLSNIVDNSLMFLKTCKDADRKGRNLFFELKELEDYLITEFIYILRFIRPFSSPGDMLWYLLVSDLNISDACAVVFGRYDISHDTKSNALSHPLPKNQLDNAFRRLDMDLNPSFRGHMSPSAADFQRELSSWILNAAESRKTTNSDKRSCEGVGSKSLVNVDWSFVVSRTSQRLDAKGKFNGSSKVHISGTLKRDSNLGEKLNHLDKGCRKHVYGSSTFKQGNFFGLSVDKNSSSPGEYNPKNASKKISKGVTVKITEDCTNKCTSSKGNGNPSSLPVNHSPSNSTISADMESSQVKRELSQATGVFPVGFTGCNDEGVENDGAKTGSTDRDPRVEMIFQLRFRLFKLKYQLEEWTEWANSRVLQVTIKLTKHKDELNSLRQDKKDPERLKQSIKENTLKKLSVIKVALSKANGQVDQANCTLRKLEVTNVELKREIEAARLQAAESAANCQEIAEREKKALRGCDSWDRQKSSLQGELISLKRKSTDMHKELTQARGVLAQLEAKREHELKAKEFLQLQASSAMLEMEQSEAHRRFKEDAFRSKAETNLQIYKDKIQMLEREIIKFSLSKDASHTDSQMKGVSRKVTGTKKSPTFNEAQFSHKSKEVQTSQNKRSKDVRRNRECAMCLSEEISVVFLPCAHQVICAKCNELHEKNGMRDCPSCRSVIQRRITVCYRTA